MRPDPGGESCVAAFSVLECIQYQCIKEACCPLDRDTTAGEKILYDQRKDLSEGKVENIIPCIPQMTKAEFQGNFQPNFGGRI